MILVVRDVRGWKSDKNVSKTMQAQKPNSYFKEEKLLIEKFGKEYKIYMNQAGTLLPKIWLK